MAADDRAALLEAQIPALRRYAFGLVRKHEAADDLVQDCLERALSRWYLRRSEGDLRAWLFTILRNLYINAYRAGRRRGPMGQLDEVSSAGTPDPAAGIEARDALAALDLLPEDQKTLLLLIGVEGLSYEEAANVLGIPIGTVMSRLARAREKLRAMLSGLPPGGGKQLKIVK